MRPLLVLVIITFVTAFSLFRIVLSFFEMQCYAHVSSLFFICLHAFACIYMYYIADETVICRNLHNPSNTDFRIARQLGYKHTLCQNVVSTI
jgi:hypothetical protein